MNRDTNLERQSNRSCLDDRLSTPPQRKFSVIKKDFVEEDSDDISVDLSALSASRLSEDLDSMNSSEPGGFKIHQPSRFSGNGPFILGAFNNWQQQPMIRVDRLAKAIDN